MVTKSTNELMFKCVQTFAEKVKSRLQSSFIDAQQSLIAKVVKHIAVCG
jgi:hypothetical protein